MTTILTKKKDTTGAPAPGDLTNAAGGAELAVNTFDKRLYTKDSGGNVVEIGTNPTILNIDNIQIDGNTISSTDVNGNIVIAPNGNGQVQITNASLDLTSIEITNIKAKDGTASATIADSTGVMTVTNLAGTTANITTVNATTVDTTNIEVTNIKAKDGTAAGSIADSTGVVTLNSAVLTTADVNGGTIDGATIGGASAGAGTFTNLTATGTVTVPNDSISGDKVEGGTINAITINTLTSTTGNITNVNATTLDTTNIEVTNIKAKDGTDAASIADSTGKITVVQQMTIDGIEVGQGGGNVATNTALGASALAANTTGANNVAVGYQALDANTIGNYNVAVGVDALGANTTGVSNTAVGNQALTQNTTGIDNSAFGAVHPGQTAGALETNSTGSYNSAFGVGALGLNTTASYNTAMGYRALYANTTGANNTAVGNYALDALTTATRNTAIGYDAGTEVTTGVQNTFLGDSSGRLITTGGKNTIVGRYNGNEDGLDIRTASNRIVISDGDGNARFYIDNTGATQVWAGGQGVAQRIFTLQGNNSGRYTTVGIDTADNQGWNVADRVMIIGKNSGTGRSINAAGTVNASGADYAEYMTKAGDFTIAKGDVIGINSDGKLTNTFADAVSFVVKSTDPSYVGGDSWGTEETLGMTSPEKPQDSATDEEKTKYELDKAAFDAALESARQRVDRIAFAGQVPVNVTGATPGQYIIPTNENGAIKGIAVSNPTFEQYQMAVGKVIAIEKDGRARIVVKVT